MPRGDRTGPMGMGPMSGRGAGFCAGNARPGFMSPVPGGGYRKHLGGRCGFGAGRGFGGGQHGRRNRFYATGRPGWMEYGDYDASNQNPSALSEKEILNDRAVKLQTELDMIKTRLGQICTEPVVE